MPKKLAKFYLRLRGRDPYFMENHITYVTFISLQRFIKELGYITDLDMANIKKHIENPESIQSPTKSLVANTIKILRLNRKPFMQFIWWLLWAPKIIGPHIVLNLQKANEKDTFQRGIDGNIRL